MFVVFNLQFQNNFIILTTFLRYQQLLHRNLVYLATIADSNQNVQALLPVSLPKFIYLFK